MSTSHGTGLGWAGSLAQAMGRSDGGRMPSSMIERVTTHPVGLPTIRDFDIIARTGSPAVRILVKVTATDGTVGWGEATPIPSRTYETAESIVTTIDLPRSPVGRPQ